MKRWIPLALAVVLLAAGEAGATVDRKGDGKSTGPASGGQSVSPSSNKLRVQCWQSGRKIIDETDLALHSLSIVNQVNGVRLRRLGDPDSNIALLTQFRTTCLLAPHD